MSPTGYDPYSLWDTSVADETKDWFTDNALQSRQWDTSVADETKRGFAETARQSRQWDTGVADATKSFFAGGGNDYYGGGGGGGDYGGGDAGYGSGDIGYQHGGPVRRRRRRRRLMRRPPSPGGPPRLRRRRRLRRRPPVGYAGGGTVGGYPISERLASDNWWTDHINELRQNQLDTFAGGARKESDDWWADHVQNAPDYPLDERRASDDWWADHVNNAPDYPTYDGGGDESSTWGADTNITGVPAFRRGGPVRKRRRRRPTGYAAGGSVNPLLMSVSLDSRSDNPMHYAEDREPLATRPGGAPEAPDEFGYQEGGEVVDDDETWEFAPEPPEDPWVTHGSPDEPEEPEPSQQQIIDEHGERNPDAETQGEINERMGRPVDAEAEPFEEEQEQPSEDGEQEQPADGEQPQKEGGAGAGGGARDAQPTGYQQQQPSPEEDPDQAPQDTGYNQQQPAPEQNALKTALDHTRRKLGVEMPAEPAGTPDETTPEQQRASAAQATAQAAAPSGTTGVAAPEPEPDQPAQPAQMPPGPGTASERMPPAPRAAPSPQPSGTASGPGNPQALQDYVSGKDGFSPDEMTELLDRTNQTNPNLGQNGAIHAAFKNLVDRNDVDGAGRFLQALRPSYDNVRALMIAASSQGDFATAMQLAERLNNLIPNGQETKFTQGPNGEIIVTIQPEGRGPPTQHVLTPEQFARYANSPLSLFDHAAEQGVGTNLSMLTGEQGRPVDQRLAQANTGTMSDAPPIAPPGMRTADAGAPAAPATGYGVPKTPFGVQGQQILQEHSATPMGQRIDTPVPRPRPAEAGPAAGQTAPAPAPAPATRPQPAPAQAPRTGYQQAPAPATRTDPNQPVSAVPSARTTPGVNAPLGAQPAAQPAQGWTPMPGSPGWFTRINPDGSRTTSRDPNAQPQAQREPFGRGVTIQNPYYRGPNGAQPAPAGAQPAPAGTQPVTGYQRGGQSPTEQRRQQEIDQFRQRRQAPGQQAPGQQQPGQQQPGQSKPESPEMRNWRLDMKAWQAFPYDDHKSNLKRGDFRRALEIQELRIEENARQRAAKGAPQTHEQKLQIKEMEIQARKDISWWTQAARTQNTAVQAETRDLISRRAAWSRDPNNAGKEFPLTKRDKGLIIHLEQQRAPGGVRFNDPRTPPPGGQVPAAPVPAPAPTPAPVPRTGGGAAAPPPPEPVLPPGVELEDYKGDKPPTANGLQLPPDSPYAWFQSKSTKEWQLRANPYYNPPKK